MSIESLENLVRIRKLKQEAPDQAQIDGMVIGRTIDTLLFNACSIRWDSSRVNGVC